METPPLYEKGSDFRIQRAKHRQIIHDNLHEMGCRQLQEQWSWGYVNILILSSILAVWHEHMTLHFIIKHLVAFWFLFQFSESICRYWLRTLPWSQSTKATHDSMLMPEKWQAFRRHWFTLWKRKEREREEKLEILNVPKHFPPSSPVQLTESMRLALKISENTTTSMSIKEKRSLHYFHQCKHHNCHVN